MIQDFTALVCDDILINPAGKLYVNGIYSHDISIQVEGAPIPQLVILFMASFEINNIPKEVILEVILPKSDPVKMTVPMSFPPLTEDRRSVSFRYPFLIQNRPLYSGKIEARIAGKDEDKVTTAGWFVSAPPLMPNASPLPS